MYLLSTMSSFKVIREDKLVNDSRYVSFYCDKQRCKPNLDLWDLV